MSTTAIFDATRVPRTMTVSLSRETILQLRERAKAEGLSYSALADRAIRLYLGIPLEAPVSAEASA